MGNKKMGHSYESILVIGWEIDIVKASGWLEEIGIGSCDSLDQCFCGSPCWNMELLRDIAPFTILRYINEKGVPRSRSFLGIEIEGGSEFVSDMMEFDTRTPSLLAAQLGATEEKLQAYSILQIT